MPTQVQNKQLPQALPCRSEQHTVRDVVASGIAGYLGTVSSLIFLIFLGPNKVIKQTLGCSAPLIVPLIVASAAVGTTAWILSRINQRQAENAPSLESRNISPLVNSSKY